MAFLVGPIRTNASVIGTTSDRAVSVAARQFGRAEDLIWRGRRHARALVRLAIVSEETGSSTTIVALVCRSRHVDPLGGRRQRAALRDDFGQRSRAW